MTELYFNPDPEWQERCLSYERVIAKIATKSTRDPMLQEDAAQEARMAIARVRPEQIHGANEPGLTDEQREEAISRYLRNTARNAILKYLTPYSTGDWSTGRTVLRGPRNNKEKVWLPSPFESYDQLTDDLGMQVDEFGRVSWTPNDDAEVHAQ